MYTALIKKGHNNIVCVAVLKCTKPGTGSGLIYIYILYDNYVAASCGTVTYVSQCHGHHTMLTVVITKTQYVCCTCVQGSVLCMSWCSEYCFLPTVFSPSPFWANLVKCTGCGLGGAAVVVVVVACLSRG